MVVALRRCVFRYHSPWYRPPESEPTREELSARRHHDAPCRRDRHTRLSQVRPSRGSRGYPSLPLGTLLYVVGGACFGTASCPGNAEPDRADGRKPHRGRKALRQRMCRVSRHARKTQRIERSVVPSDSGFSGRGHAIFGSADLLDCETRHTAIRHVRQRQVGFRSEVVDDHRLSCAHQIFAAAGAGRVGETQSCKIIWCEKAERIWKWIVRRKKEEAMLTIGVR